MQTASITKSTPTGGLFIVFTSVMSVLFKAFRLFSAAINMGRAWPAANGISIQLLTVSTTSILLTRASAVAARSWPNSFDTSKRDRETPLRKTVRRTGLKFACCARSSWRNRRWNMFLGEECRLTRSMNLFRLCWCGTSSQYHSPYRNRLFISFN